MYVRTKRMIPDGITLNYETHPLLRCFLTKVYEFIMYSSADK